MTWLPCETHGLGLDAAPVTRLCPRCLGERLAGGGYSTKPDCLPDEHRRDVGLPEPLPVPVWPTEPAAPLEEWTPQMRLPSWYRQKCEALSRAVWRGEITSSEAARDLDACHPAAFAEGWDAFEAAM